jgi:hypothetical protein
MAAIDQHTGPSRTGDDTMPIIRVVTQTDPQTDTIKAFQAELVAKVTGSIDYRVYSAADDNDNLDEVVKYAVSDSRMRS